MTHIEANKARLERAQQAAHMVLQGKSRRHVGAMLGISRQRVQQLLKLVA